MGEITTPLPVKFICPIIHSSVYSHTEIVSVLQENFGSIDYISSSMPFDFTDYYCKEMGDKLYRFFTSFEDLIAPDKIADIKIATNQLEEEMSHKQTGERRVNLDPGYLETSKLVLASTKNYSHRIYLQKGIYAEVTLRYYNKAFRDLPWTFPDYRTDEYKAIFHHIRQIYKQQL